MEVVYQVHITSQEKSFTINNGDRTPRIYEDSGQKVAAELRLAAHSSRNPLIARLPPIPIANLPLVLLNPVRRR